MPATGSDTMAKGLAAHLENLYDIAIDGITTIESVYAVDRREGPPWIARLFPAARPIEATQGDAEILRFLEDQRFPSEQCADEEPVSIFDGQSVLVTRFLPGRNGRPDQSPKTMRAMGDLLGRLQTLPDAEGAIHRPAGSWHHLAIAGGGRREDLAALAPLLADAKFSALRDELARMDLLDDLPRSLIHPDCVSANVMLSDDGPTLIDWTGAGRGPRIAPLGQLLATASANLALVDEIVAGYRAHISLEPEERARLADAVQAFGLILDCWMAAHHPQLLPRIVNDRGAKRHNAEAIAVRARAAFTA